MNTISLERIGKTFIETAKSHGISADTARKGFEEAVTEMNLRRKEKGYVFKDSLEKAARKMANDLVECQTTCIWY